MAEEPEYLTVADAAEFLGVSRRRLWDLIRSGIVKDVRKNPFDRREWLIPRTEVEQLARFAPKKEAA